jgi:retron-type reverse transcriptase
MECIGKLLEKIITKWINMDIKCCDLLLMLQFGSQPYHSTINTMATLIHKIQGTQATGHASALLLFDISGFFDNINLG